MLRLVRQMQFRRRMVHFAERINFSRIFFRLLPQNSRKRRILVINCNAARTQSAENLRFGVGDILQAAQKFNMHRINIGNNRHVRLNQMRQIINLSPRRHSRLNHRVARVHIHIKQRARHPDLIIKIAARCVCRRIPGQCRFQFLLGRRLARTAGQRDNRPFELPPVMLSEFTQRLQRAVRHNQPFAVHTRHRMFGNRQRRSFIQHLADKIMPVKFFPFKCDKQRPPVNFTAVGRYFADFRINNFSVIAEYGGNFRRTDCFHRQSLSAIPNMPLSIPRRIYFATAYYIFFGQRRRKKRA